ncbi:RNA-directed DNA polymerase [Bradyrhizobium sp. BR 10261]|uniref:RNA-directed DNA polymerase n=1 Tax=Bradyrhizobium sp. BR 10261 TaxID=2749992 RepID=UPI001C64E323|nr:RNA-directed DNA polymerase [Bradyrhizobium sp. BR 10261]MBW7962482.1 RNA-directed DNA polymerase [Bradyrhizobium sp. BR 10261]
MDKFFERAISNVIRHGDTDIFPFPIENHIFFDKRAQCLDLLREIHKDFDGNLNRYPPAHDAALAPVNYTGFRWATQMDPLWNLYFLALVLSISDAIERARLPVSAKRVFSYRCRWDDDTADIFDSGCNWRDFMECSLEHTKKFKFVVVCDISEFYPRLGHHRLENALLQLATVGDTHSRIMSYLKNYSNTNSFGLPVGGPAARILSELVLNQIDRLLEMEGITFCRFADDFHIFCDSDEEAYARLIFLSEKLLRTQGLQLQKSKTRIMSSAEFAATNPLNPNDGDSSPSGSQSRAKGLMQLSLRFDPYSPTKNEDYAILQAEIERFDILGLLREELLKSRIHIGLARKIVAAVKYLEPRARDDAITTMVDNAELLYPIFSSVLTVARAVFDDLSPVAQVTVHKKIIELIENHSHVLRVDLNLAYALRVLSCRHSPEAEAVLVRIFKLSTSSSLLRRDIILTMAKWKNWYWLSDLRASFQSLSVAERRAFIVASYSLRDEGKHWRQHTSDQFSPFEQLVQRWASEKANQSGWSIPL